MGRASEVSPTEVSAADGLARRRLVGSLPAEAVVPGVRVEGELHSSGRSRATPARVQMPNGPAQPPGVLSARREVGHLIPRGPVLQRDLTTGLPLARVTTTGAWSSFTGP